jgi:hypothetical protein
MTDSVRDVVSKFTPLGKALAGALAAASLLAVAAPGLKLFLCITAGKTLPFRFWTLLTSGFVEQSAFTVSPRRRSISTRRWTSQRTAMLRPITTFPSVEDTSTCWG